MLGPSGVLRVGSCDWPPASGLELISYSKLESLNRNRNPRLNLQFVFYHQILSLLVFQTSRNLNVVIKIYVNALIKILTNARPKTKIWPINVILTVKRVKILMDHTYVIVGMDTTNKMRDA